MQVSSLKHPLVRARDAWADLRHSITCQSVASNLPGIANKKMVQSFNPFFYRNQVVLFDQENDKLRCNL